MANKKQAEEDIREKGFSDDEEIIKKPKVYENEEEIRAERIRDIKRGDFHENKIGFNEENELDEEVKFEEEMKQEGISKDESLEKHLKRENSIRMKKDYAEGEEKEF